MKKLIILLLILCLLVPGVLALPPKIIMTVSGTGGTVPYTVEVSEDSKDETIVRWEWVLQGHVDNLPLGKPITGTKA